MKKLLALLFLVTVNAFAFDVGTNYNSANMSYPANSTIQQTVVFNSTMQAGGTFVFKVDAHSGGGRPLQHDTASIQIQFWNGNTHLGTQQTTGVVLEQMNAWSGAPGDNSEPWETLSVTSQNCAPAASCANVTHVKIVMIGTDTSWWAGNYGPQWRLPTFTFNGGNNLAYNPEFGSYGGTIAQGWTSSSGWGTCGTTSGSVMCTTAASGVTANMSAGGYDPNGGTTSGTAGGYTGTLSIADANAGTGGGAAAPAPIGPTVEGGTITQTNSPGTETITSGGSSTAGISASQQTRVTTWININQSYNNELYITQTYGSNNNFTITQDGTKNKMEVTVGGNGNVSNVTQTGRNYLKQEVPGWGNNITINQSNITGGSNYAETKIQGNGNTVSHQQSGVGSHILFTVSAGDINTITTTQSGAVGHKLDVKMTGNWNSVISSQTGDTQNKANVDLTNAGGGATVDIQQTGAKNFTIIQSCANPNGCSTVIRQ